MALRQKVRALVEQIGRMMRLPVNPSVRGTAQQANRTERHVETGRGGKTEGRGHSRHGGRGGKRSVRKRSSRR